MQPSIFNKLLDIYCHNSKSKNSGGIITFFHKGFASNSFVVEI